MFPEMRRKNQQLSREESIQVLERGTAGLLAVSGADGYPYAVPMSYVYADGALYFHCARSGHKLDAVRREEKASFCVIDADRIVPEELTTYYRSVIAFGRARILEDAGEVRAAIRLLARRYSPDSTDEKIEGSIDRELPALCMVEFTIEHLTGKEAIELRRAGK